MAAASATPGSLRSKSCVLTCSSAGVFELSRKGWQLRSAPKDPHRPRLIQQLATFRQSRRPQGRRGEPGRRWGRSRLRSLGKFKRTWGENGTGRRLSHRRLFLFSRSGTNASESDAHGHSFVGRPTSFCELRRSRMHSGNTFCSSTLECAGDNTGGRASGMRQANARRARTKRRNGPQGRFGPAGRRWPRSPTRGSRPTGRTRPGWELLRNCASFGRLAKLYWIARLPATTTTSSLTLFAERSGRRRPTSRIWRFPVASPTRFHKMLSDVDLDTKEPVLCRSLIGC